jgi:hypothetical protein
LSGFLIFVYTGFWFEFWERLWNTHRNSPAVTFSGVIFIPYGV